MSVFLKKLDASTLFSERVFAFCCYPFVKLFLLLNVSANIVTVLGFALTCLACLLMVWRGPHESGGFWITITLFLSNCFDFADGRIARATSTSSVFGAKLDVIIDKVSVAIILIAWSLTMDKIVEVTLIFSVGFMYYINNILSVYYDVLRDDKVLSGREGKKSTDQSLFSDLRTLGRLLDSYFGIHHSNFILMVCVGWLFGGGIEWIGVMICCGTVSLMAKIFSAWISR